MTWRTLFLLSLVVATVLAGGTTIVFAHADYDRSTPAKDEVVAQAPAQVDVFFTQEVFKQEGRNFVRVFNDQSTQVSQGDGEVDDDDRTHIAATLQPGLPAGRYVVRWMTTSDADGDTDEGAFCFHVAVEPTAAQAAECAALDEDGAPATQPPPTQILPTPSPPEPTTAEPTATPTDAGEEDDDGAPVGAIIGGIIAGVVALAVVAGGAALWMRRASG